MKKNLLTFFGLIIITSLLTLVLVPVPVLADEEIGDLIENQMEPIQNIYGQEQVSPDTFAVAVAKIISIVLGFLGIIFLVLMIYAGFTWMTAAGNEESITRAKKTMIAAVIGVAIVLVAYAITVFVINSLLEATGAEGFE
ncbi:MAG: hypothetical protein WC675_04295 [Patescibacteria group bacterium]|jgi:hypothetical protein